MDINKKGRLIVIEGLDGSGKGTQAEKLKNRLLSEGRSVKLISFPDYDDDSSKLVQMYLAGEFGSSPDDVNAYAASSFYAVDRYASYRRHWKKDYDNGAVIIANRYTTSNALHQMSKLETGEREEYLTWLFDYEYRLLGLPEPDLVVFLDMPTEVSRGLISKRYCGDESKRDIHEQDDGYLKRCRECALYVTEHCGWQKISCAADGQPLGVDIIADMLYNTILKVGLI